MNELHNPAFIHQLILCKTIWLLAGISLNIMHGYEIGAFVDVKYVA